jgi:hypothetical protein
VHTAWSAALEHCTSQDTIRENLRRAGKFVTRLGHLASLTAAGVRAWRQARLGEVSRKTVNLEMDTPAAARPLSALRLARR